MAVGVTLPRTKWWRLYARRLRRSPHAIAEIVPSAARTPQRFPRVRLRVVNGDAEPYLPEAGLAVWEVAWLAREYDGNSAAVASHALVDIDVIEEGLSYAAAHAQEIEAQIISHTEVPLEKLRELLPGLRVITIDPDDPGGRSE